MLSFFLTSLRVTAYANVTVANVRKPVCPVDFQHKYVAFAKETLVVPPASSLLPFSREPRLLHLTVPPVSSLITGVPRIRAHIELGRKDGWKTLGRGEGRELDVYEASLRGGVRPQGLRCVVATFPSSLAVAAAGESAEEPETEVKVEQTETPSPLEDSTTLTSVRRRSSRVKEESSEDENTLSPRANPTSERDVRRRFKRSSTHDNE